MRINPRMGPFQVSALALLAALALFPPTPANAQTPAPAPAPFAMSAADATTATDTMFTTEELQMLPACAYSASENELLSRRQ